MKKYITAEQFNELSQEEREMARKICKHEAGSKVFVELKFTEEEKKKYNGIYTGVVTKSGNKEHSATYDTGKTTGPFKHIIQEKDYPLFSIGELLEIVEEDGNSVPHAIVEVDRLWKQVKEIIKKKLEDKE